MTGDDRGSDRRRTRHVDAASTRSTGADRASSQTTPWGIDRIDADRLLAGGKTGNGASVAVVSTGIDQDHPDLPTPVRGKDFTGTGSWNDDNGQGTLVAGVVAALDNAAGVVGVGPDLDLLAAKVLDSGGGGSLSDVAAGIEWAANVDADVICIPLRANSGTTALKDACQYAADNGSVLVATVGDDYGASVGYPAAYETVIAVSATNQNDTLATFSNVGPEVELAAPGRDVYSTFNTGGYDTLSSAAMAAAHVAGAAGVVVAETGFTDRTTVRDRLKNTAEDVGLASNEQGSGLVDAANAVPLYGVRWRFDVGSRLQYAAPAADGSRVFAGSLDATFYALDRFDGTVDWSFERDGALADSSPVVSGGRVYVGSGGGTLYAFDADADSATVDWTFTTDSALVSSPTVDGDIVYVGSNDGRVFALDDTASGSELWQRDVGAPVFSSPSVGDGRVHVLTDDGEVIAFEKTYGFERWRYDVGTSDLDHASPLAANGRIYVAADEVYALETSSNIAFVDWSAPYSVSPGSTPVYDADTDQLFVGTADGTLYAFDASSGDEQWQYDTGEAVEATPAVAGNRVFVASEAGHVAALDVDDGSTIATQSIDSSRAGLTVDGSLAFLGTKAGSVVALWNATP